MSNQNKTKRASFSWFARKNIEQRFTSLTICAFIEHLLNARCLLHSAVSERHGPWQFFMKLAIIWCACWGHVHMRVHFKEVGDKLIANVCIYVCSKWMSGLYCSEELLKCLASGPGWPTNEPRVVDESSFLLSLLKEEVIFYRLPCLHWAQFTLIVRKKGNKDERDKDQEGWSRAEGGIPA